MSQPCKSNYAQMTKIEEMFASLLLMLLKSMASETMNLSDIKEFICELLPLRSIKSIAVVPMFDSSSFENISSIRELMMLLNDYWSFFNFSLLKKLVDKFGGEYAKDALKKYVTVLQELSVQKIPVLLHHRFSIAGFSSDILTVTITGEIFSLSVEDLLSVRDSIARILHIENFALLLLRIKKVEKQLEFLIANQVTVKVGPLEFSSVNEVNITSLKYQGSEWNHEKKFSEPEDDEGIVLFI